MNVNPVRRLIVSVCVCTILACSSKEEASQAFYSQAMAYLAAGAHEKARLELLNAIQRNPQNAHAYYQLGLMARDQANLALAFENIAIATQLDDNLLPAHISLAQLYLYAQRFEEAEKILQAIPPDATITDAQAYEVLALRAAVELGFKRLDSAALLVAEALEKNPKDPQMYGLLAAIAQERGHTKHVIEHLNRAIELSEEKTQFLSLRAGVHRQLQDLAALEIDYRALMRENPDEGEYVFLLSRLLTDRQQFQEAEAVVEEFIAAHPGHQSAKAFLIEMILAVDEARGLRLLDDTIAREENDAEFRLLRVRLLTRSQSNPADNRVAAKAELRDMLSHAKYASTVKYKSKAMLAEILLKEGARSEAMALVMENLSANNQHEYSHLLKAEDDLAQRKYDDAIASLRTVLRNNPDSEKALVLLGRVYDASGSDLLADDAFRQALTLNPRNVEAAVPVASKLIAAQDLERSDAIIARALASRPNDLKLLLFQAQIKILKKDWDGAAANIARLQRSSEGDAYVELMLGQVAQGRGDCVAAVTSYHSALKLKPTLVPAMRELSLCYLGLNKAEELLQFLQSFQTEHPSAVHAYLVAAQLHRGRGDMANALEALTLGIANNPEWLDGYALLAGYYDELGNTTKAIEVFKRGIKANPQNYALPVLLAGLYQSKSMNEEAVLAYEGILRQQPDHLVVRNNYAVLLLAQDDTQAHKKALELAAPLQDLSQAQFIDTYGWALYKNKRYAEAEIVFRKAAESATKIAEIQYHFAQTLAALERYAEASVVLKRASKLDASEKTQSLIDQALASSPP